MPAVFEEHPPRRIVHRPAQAAVRIAIESQQDCVDAILSGLVDFLDGCRAVGGKDLVNTSISPVDGAKTKMRSRWQIPWIAQ